MPSNNVNVARRYLGELWSRGRYLAAHELVAPSCTVHDPLVGEYEGIEALTAHVRELRRAFPDLTWAIGEILADAGTQLALMWTATGTHRGPLGGLPATARPIELSGLLLLRFEGDKLVAITTRWDPQSLWRQLSSSPFRRRRSLRPVAAAPAEESELDAQWTR